MKKERIVLIISLIIMSLSSIVSAMAVSAYLYNSNEVSYNNNASGITSTNVQGAIDELYRHVTDYTSMDTRVSALEGKFTGNPNITFNGTNGYNRIKVYTSSNKDGGLALYDSNNTTRGYLYYDSSSYRTYLASYNSSGEWGKGTLDLRGNPVMINGFDYGNSLVYRGDAPSNLDDATASGFYYLDGTARTNQPTGTSWTFVAVLSNGIKMQIIFLPNAIYTRRFSGNPSAWGSWYKFTGTLVN